MNGKDREIRCGVIGCGVIAPVHMEALSRLENVTITWACDLVEEKAKALAERFSIPKITTDYREMLADPQLDAVHVCTDHSSHAQISSDALDHGKHVLCEKALAAHPEELDLMLAAHARHPELVFSGVFQHRFEPVNQYLRHLIAEGHLGTMLNANVRVLCLRTPEYYRSGEWRGTWAQEGGGVCINQAIHFIDLLVWIMGGVDGVCGEWRNLTHQDVIEVEDSAVAALRFRNGAPGILQATSSTTAAKWDFFLGFYGSEGIVEIHQNKPHRVIHVDPEKQRDMEEKLNNLNDAFPGLNTAKAYYGPGHRAQVADFIEAIRESRSPFVEARSAAHSAAVVHSIYRSAKEGSWVSPSVC